MPISRRSMLAAAGASIASAGAVAGSPDHAELEEAAASLIQRSLDSNAALMRGNVDGYRALIQLSDDFTLMSPFGGKPSRAADITNESWEAMSRFFKNGTLEQEVIESYVSPDLIVLAIIEKALVEVGGLPRQDWHLRVTLVYRRESSQWLLAHRHADPLATGIPLNQAAALARGAPVPTGSC